jgi:hypothetical protein
LESDQLFEELLGILWITHMEEVKVKLLEDVLL